MRHCGKLLTLVLVLPCIVSAYTYSAWTGMTGAKTVAVNPWFSIADASDPGGLSLDAVFGYGITDKIDCFADIASLSPLKDGEYTQSWLLSRYALAENKILALQLIFADEELTVSPQFHCFSDREKLALEMNAALSLTPSDMESGAAWGTLGLVYKLLPDQLYPFMEFNPGLSWAGGTSAFDFTLAPGLWIGIKDTPHQFILSAPVSGLKDSDVSLGITCMYWVSFGIGANGN